MVAELRLSDPLPDLAFGGVLELGISRSESAIGGVLELGVSRSELYIFESSRMRPAPPSIGTGA